MVSICVPLAINVLLLVIFQPFYIVLWYLMVCAGFVTLCAGLAGKYLSTGGVAAVLDPMVLIYVGVSLIGAALLALAGFVVYRKLTAGDATMKYAEALRYYRRFHRKRALLHLGVFIFCLLIGLLLCRFVVVTMPQGSSADLLQYGGFFIVGIIFLVLAVVAFTYMVINFTREGRLLTERSTEWMKRNVLLVLLALVSTSFIPTISYAMENFMCARLVTSSTRTRTAHRSRTTRASGATATPAPSTRPQRRYVGATFRVTTRGAPSFPSLVSGNSPRCRVKENLSATSTPRPPSSWRTTSSASRCSSSASFAT